MRSRKTPIAESSGPLERALHNRALVTSDDEIPPQKRIVGASSRPRSLEKVLNRAVNRNGLVCSRFRSERARARFSISNAVKTSCQTRRYSSRSTCAHSDRSVDSEKALLLRVYYLCSFPLESGPHYTTRQITHTSDCCAARPRKSHICITGSARRSRGKTTPPGSVRTQLIKHSFISQFSLVRRAGRRPCVLFSDVG